MPSMLGLLIEQVGRKLLPLCLVSASGREAFVLRTCLGSPPDARCRTTGYHKNPSKISGGRIGVIDSASKGVRPFGEWPVDSERHRQFAEGCPATRRSTSPRARN